MTLHAPCTRVLEIIEDSIESGAVLGLRPYGYCISKSKIVGRHLILKTSKCGILRDDGCDPLCAASYLVIDFRKKKQKYL
jgi:hypothetical protein